MFLEISHNLQESTCARVSFLINLNKDSDKGVLCDFFKGYAGGFQ